MNAPRSASSAGLAWEWRMAWRDSRRSRRRLLLYVMSMVLGVSALVAVTSFGQNLLDAVDRQAKTLLGADLRLESDAPFADETEALLDSLGGQQARMISFASMAYFPSHGETRLARIRALDGRFPFYGEIETDPPAAAERLEEGAYALVDEALMLQFGARVGDELRVGDGSYTIAGQLIKVPGESAAGALIGPRVFVPLQGLDEELLGRGSRVEYEAYVAFTDEDVDAEEIREAIRPHLEAFDLGIDTVQEERREWGNALEDLYSFLNLVAFIALLLGGLGVASSVHVYVRGKVDAVATLRCLGASTRQAFMVYLLQSVAMGLAGALIGAGVGIVIQFLLPVLLTDFIPVDVVVRTSWSAVLEGVGVGLSVSLAFALLPLLRIRRISPLRALRASVESVEARRDFWPLLIWTIIGLALVAFSWRQTGRLDIALGFSGGLAVVFLLLFGVARGLMLAIRRFFPSGWRYTWRQGLANLYRPNNQTAILLLALGLGTFLIMTLYLTQHTLLGKIEGLEGESSANVVLFDVQRDQVEGVMAIVDSLSLPPQEPVPIVTMRLAEVNGRRVDQIIEDTTYTGSRWPLRREYRSSYRDHLTDTETLIEGRFVGVADRNEGPAPVSLERDIASDLQVSVGDELVFDVQGVLVPTVVGSIREVDWQRISTNFFVVFPKGVIDDAPQFSVITTRTDSPEERAGLQQAVVERFPNVSIIDLELILRTAEELLGRISLVIQFMALFSILTGVTVLFGSVVISRFQRIRESVLLRTLGASRSQIRTILVVEYVLLGCLAALTGVLLSMVGTWALALWVFDTAFTPPPGPIIVAFVLVSALTVTVGLGNSRGVITRPPLEVLRSEAE